MKRLVVVFVFLVNVMAFSQLPITKLKGNWVKWKVDKADGSELVDSFVRDSIYVKFIIKEKEICKEFNASNYVYDKGDRFEYKDSILKINPFFSYKIEKLTQDSLILKEDKYKVPVDQQDRYYLVREEQLPQHYLKLYEGKQYIKANRYFSPKVDYNKLMFDINYELYEIESHLTFMGSISIHPKTKIIETDISYMSRPVNKAVRLITKAFSSSFKLWKWEYFDRFETIEIPFIIDYYKTGSVRFTRLYFYTNNLTSLGLGTMVTVNDQSNAQTAFEKGLKAYQQKDYKLAIEKFDEANTFNPLFLEPVYNIAAIYFEQEQLEKACEVWSRLADLKQTKAINFIEEYCQKK